MNQLLRSLYNNDTISCSRGETPRSSHNVAYGCLNKPNSLTSENTVLCDASRDYSSDGSNIVGVTVGMAISMAGMCCTGGK